MCVTTATQQINKVHKLVWKLAKTVLFAGEAMRGTWTFVVVLSAAGAVRIVALSYRYIYCTSSSHFRSLNLHTMTPSTRKTIHPSFTVAMMNTKFATALMVIINTQLRIVRKQTVVANTS